MKSQYENVCKHSTLLSRILSLQVYKEVSNISGDFIKNLVPLTWHLCLIHVRKGRKERNFISQKCQREEEERKEKD